MIGSTPVSARKRTSRYAIGALLACVQLVACSSAPSTEDRGIPSPRTSGSQEVLVLTADLSEEIGPWQPMLSIPFGEERSQLGYEPAAESAPLGPSSFLVDDDGSFWVTDPAKERIAHYTASGTLLGSVAGIAPTVSDLALAGGSMFVLEDGARGSLTRIQDGLPSEDMTITQGGDPVSVSSLLGFPQVLVASLSGYVKDVEAGPHGYGRIQVPDGGAAESLPGIPVGPDTWMDVTPGSGGRSGDALYDIAFTRGEIRSVQPVRFSLLAGPGGRSDGDMTEAVPIMEIVTGHEVGMYVRIAAAPSAGGATREGRWFLQLGPEGSPVIWERLPDPEVDDEGQNRHLATGPDGAVYLMVLDREGITIFRR